jgi:hypothetical protein
MDGGFSAIRRVNDHYFQFLCWYNSDREIELKTNGYLIRILFFFLLQQYHYRKNEHFISVPSIIHEL